MLFLFSRLAKLGLESLSKFTNKWKCMRDIENLYKYHVTSISGTVTNEEKKKK